MIYSGLASRPVKASHGSAGRRLSQRNLHQGELLRPLSFPERDATRRHC